jgi:hypothetical protein
VAGLLAGHLRAGELAQLGIDLRDQGTGCIGLASLDSCEEEGDVAHARTGCY